MGNTKIYSKFLKGTIVLSIDDGNRSDFRLCRDVLSKLNIPATFNIVTDSIGHKECLTKEQLKSIYENPLMEIAAHGHTHSNDD